MTRQQMQKIIKFLFNIISKTEYENTEFVPSEGPLIVVTNHLSRMDSLVLLGNPVRTEIIALVAKKYKSRPFFAYILDTCGSIYIDRTRADFGAFREARKVIKSGTALGIAPEGTRSNNGQLAEAKDGAAMLAMQLQVPVVPVGITGTEDMFKKLGKLQIPRITAKFGRAFVLPKLTAENRAEQLKHATDEIMCRIAVLLPEQYRGFYQGHPRLNEFENTGNPNNMPVF